MHLGETLYNLSALGLAFSPMAGGLLVTLPLPAGGICPHPCSYTSPYLCYPHSSKFPSVEIMKIPSWNLSRQKLVKVSIPALAVQSKLF
jgi:hypothetical protein